MKKKSFIYAVALAATTLISCQSDDLLGEQGEGYIQLSTVDIDKKIQTRADGTTETIAVDILDATGNSFVHADDWTELQGKSYLVKAGNEYTIKAYSYGKTVEQGFDVTPVYSGESNVTVEAGVNKTVDITCKQAQAMVTVNYSDNFKRHFTDYSTALIGTNGVDATFEGDEASPYYVKAGQKLTSTLTLTPIGGSQTVLPSHMLTEAALAAYRYNINYDVDITGTGTINVVVDQNLHEYEITLGVPLEPDGVTTLSIAGDASKVWGTSATLCGACSFVEPQSVNFMYKKSDAAEWTTAAGVRNGETYEYSLDITGLEMGTKYDYKIVGTNSTGDAKEGDVLSFITEAYVEIPNLNFDTWTQSGKNWFANADASDSYWATGNTGVTSILAGGKDPITVAVEGADARNGKAAKMATLTGITLVGSAAGNLFIGSYKTNMQTPSASVSFGRAYTGARPRRLTGWYKYTSTPITNGTWYDDHGQLTNDACNIYVRVWDADGNEIGFGEFVGRETVSEYTQFSFDITYSDPSKHAAKITIVTTSSLYGGHFSGNSVTGQVGSGSTLWVDDFELSY